MRSTFDEMSREADELRALVDSITPVNDALATHQDSLVRQYLTIRRRFDYAAFVVALYASFEKFVENLVGSYARLMAARNQYSALPQNLVKKHLAKSAELLSRGRLGEGRYAEIRELDVVKNLFDCLSGATPYSLNDVAVTSHDSNFRSQQVIELFSVIGVDQVAARVRRTDPILQWYCASKAMADEPPDGVPISSIDHPLEDLVERRNQITHRGGNPLNLMGVDEMGEMIEFIVAYARSLFVLTVAAYLRGHHADSGSATPLGRLRGGPYKDGQVVVVARPSCRVFVSQPVFGLADGWGARWGRIQDIQVDDVSVASVDVSSPAAEVGLRLDFKCTRGTDLYLLANEDDAVWGS